MPLSLGPSLPKAPLPPSPAITDLNGVLISTQFMQFAKWFLQFP